MDEDLVGRSSSSDGDVQASPFPYSDFLDRQCLKYMTMGMSYEEFWDGSDLEKPKYMRQAYEMQKHEKNFFAWLQGAYFYQALVAASPSFLSLAKDRTPLDYTDQLIPLTEKEAEEQEKRIKQRRMNKAIEHMHTVSTNINAQIKSKNEEGGVKNG